MARKVQLRKSPRLSEKKQEVQTLFLKDQIRKCDKKNREMEFWEAPLYRDKDSGKLGKLRETENSFLVSE